MTSPSPLLYDSYYHIYNRGINRENIFIEERNYAYFLDLQGKHVAPVADLYAYCLLRNHFHMLVRVRSEEEIRQTLKVSGDEKSLKVSETFRDSYPSKKFSDFFNAYAKAINKAYNRTGSLFQHPFGRVLVTSDRQLWNVIAYIHQHPQKHKFVDDFRDWKYSSYGIMLGDAPGIVQRAAVLDWFGDVDGYRQIHAQWVSDAQSKWFAEDDFD